MKIFKQFLFLSITPLLSSAAMISTAQASDSLTVKTISMELARDLASESLNICRKKGYQVSAVVVDRSGVIQVALRDDLASRFTLQIAEEKANKESDLKRKIELQKIAIQYDPKIIKSIHTVLFLVRRKQLKR